MSQHVTAIQPHATLQLLQTRGSGNAQNAPNRSQAADHPRRGACGTPRRRPFAEKSPARHTAARSRGRG
eukprot:11018640-Alexandrium_andersonii.AAC.1